MCTHKGPGFEREAKSLSVDGGGKLRRTIAIMTLDHLAAWTYPQFPVNRSWR